MKQKYAKEIYLQQGKNLGERMYHAFQHSLKTYAKTVLIGSDCPSINKPYIEQAFNKLDNNEIVFGPAEDGGYVLIGANKICDTIFNNVKWGSDKVLEQSLQNMNATDYKVDLLATLWDIDTPEDYKKYQKIQEQESA
ncbi:hypothetical protein MNBD_GAMMA07-1944 [hydrothermal vent metagenome]|uniref:Glycosyltransferase n=1 Tax=hydrothermal vent metagenome TaxID=652676 RepID=A0A3B0WA57_9ZZZZ